MIIKQITLRRLNLPLIAPYRLSYRTFHTFEPYLIEIMGRDGRIAYGDAHIAPGSSNETRKGGWNYLKQRLCKLPGLTLDAAKALMLADFEQSKVATTSVVTAIESLEDTPILHLAKPVKLPLLAPIDALSRKNIEQEVETAISSGYKTLKIKVGKDVDADIKRLGFIQSDVAGRAVLRIDANRAYSRSQAMRFVQKINPEGVVLFEQPCEADAWDDNAAIAAISNIPIMLDEPICSLHDIERAAAMPGVAFCKVKLKRFGGLERLATGIRHIQSHGMTAILGDGLGSDLHGWFEATVAAQTLNTVGEFNGFLKMAGRLLKDPLPFSNGTIHLPAQFKPQLNPEFITSNTTAQLTFG